MSKQEFRRFLLEQNSPSVSGGQGVGEGKVPAIDEIPFALRWMHQSSARSGVLRSKILLKVREKGASEQIQINYLSGEQSGREGIGGY